ncbi:Cryptochrome-like protein cry2 (plasmid) [Pseudoalteromonas sp. THAF3]|uniref:FAD-binding domain-containing protein n=1 Tax=Pseudoalteromonas sp. THAF3 TaxID=2587843 RepID=UPI0012693D18|nr:FAD-binding domain-containing protein [Pseudoalteromonas sp. THAF3]QFU06680.1 Cryptochrome-like protein cry2 [Pseudoalteromonas sp. THAF3]
MISLVWLKRDLRINDHAPIHFAAQSMRPVLCLYVIEPEYWCLDDTSERQFRFVAQALRSLATQLERIGGRLLVRRGEVCDILARIHLHAPIHTLYSHQETGNSWTYSRDNQVFSWCRERSIAIATYRQQAVFRGAIERDHWQTKAQHWLKQPQLESPTHLTSLLSHHDGLALLDHYPGNDNLIASGAQHGAHACALATQQSFLATRMHYYRGGISSVLSAPTRCSRLSPYLAYGVISLRESIQSLGAIKGPAGHKRAVLARLHWHSHFVQKLESEPSYCEHAVHRDLIHLRAEQFDQQQFLAWCQGQTGVPFIDACMRFLHHYGWINFRMRAMLIAYASYQLWLDWRQPAAFLAAQFVDYEPGIHYPQVQMQSGCTGINPWRMYNPVTQGQKYDPHGHFIRRWLPELSKVPSAYVHTPWLYNGLSHDTYPHPSVLPDIALRQAKARIADYYQRHVNSRETARVGHQHGSRKRQPKATRKTKSSKQLGLF